MIVRSGQDIIDAVKFERKRKRITARKLADMSGINIHSIHDLLYRAGMVQALGRCLPVLHALGLELIIVRRNNHGKT